MVRGNVYYNLINFRRVQSWVKSKKKLIGDGVILRFKIQKSAILILNVHQTKLGDGVISKSEFKLGLFAAGIDIPPKQQDAMWKLADTGKSG
jgi:hypothetical protein